MMSFDEIVEVLRAHVRGHEYYDAVLDRTQWLCGCREWVYDHPQHVADELIAAVPDVNPGTGKPWIEHGDGVEADL